MRGVLYLFFLSLFCCKSQKVSKIDSAEDFEYSKPYYITVAFKPENSHPHLMGGIGLYNNFKSLENSSDVYQFLYKFYSQIAYAPLIINIEVDYKRKVACLGYQITWYEKYYEADIYSKPVSEKKLKLSDGMELTITSHYINKDLRVQYIEDSAKCFKASSLELKLDKFKNIEKIAILLD